MKISKLLLFISVFFFSCEDIFDRKFLFEVSVFPEEGGNISLKTGYYEKGQKILIEATPNNNFIFKGWVGDIESSNNQLEFSLDSDTKITANFSLIDEDLDGIADKLDICPETNRGSLVDENGCCIDASFVSFRKLSNIPYVSAYNSSASDGSSIYLSKGVRINSDNIIERAPEVLRYDIIDDKWYVFLDNVNPVSFGASEVVGSNLYLFNGKNNPVINNKILNDTVEKVDLLTKKISKFTINPYPSVQCGSAVWQENIIFFGGRDLDGCSDRIVKYDVYTGEFKIIGNIPYPICNAKGEVYDNKLYIVGGDLGNDQSEEILIFDLSDNNWLESFKMPIKISNHTTGIYKNRIFIKGDFNILNLLAVFDITQSKFSIIESNVTESRYLTSQIVNGEFYVMGGNVTSNYSTMIDDLMVLNLNEEGYFCF